MVNFKLKNKNSKKCAYCGSEPKNMMKTDNWTTANTIKNVPATKPLHGLVRGMEKTFRAGYRKRANVLKYDNMPSPITVPENERVKRWYI